MSTYSITVEAEFSVEVDTIGGGVDFLSSVARAIETLRAISANSEVVRFWHVEEVFAASDDGDSGCEFCDNKGSSIPGAGYEDDPLDDGEY